MLKKFWFFPFVFLLTPFTLFASDPLFETTGLTYLVGCGPHSVIAIDLDGDGELDLAVANSCSNNISVLINDGFGTFLPKVDYPTGKEPLSISAADFDGDGDVDLAAANFGDVEKHDSSTVSVLKNNGDGTFSAKIDYLTGLSSIAVFAGDLDGDGDIDLAVANSGYFYDPDYSDYEDSTVSVLLNNADGTFANKVDYVTGIGAGSVFSVDINGDGDLDLVVANSPAKTISTLENNGDGAFGNKVDYPTITGAGSLFSADLDGDSDFDLITASLSGISVFKNNGDGTFAAKVDYSLGPTGATSVFAADFDADGDVDLAATNWGSAVSVLTNNGDGSFSPWVGYGYGTLPNPSSVYAADLDGDGDSDLAVANGGSSRVSILKNNGNGTFFPARLEYSIKRWPIFSMVLSDLDLDGDFDLALTYVDSTLAVLKNNGRGIFSQPVVYQARYVPTSLIASDFDGDGDNDLVVANAGYGIQPGSTVSIFKNNGDGSFLPRVDYPAIKSPFSVFASDLDRDGDLDLAVAGYGGIVTLSNNGNGSFAAPALAYFREAAFGFVYAADMDGDKDPDLVFPNWVTNIYTFSILKNNGDGSFGSRVDHLTGNQPLRAYAFDLDLDGDNDVVTINDGGGNISVLKNNGDGIFGTRADYRFGSFASHSWLACSDFDEDGYPDLIVTDYYSGRVCSFFRNLGDGTFSDEIEFYAGSFPEQLAAADLDGDGDKDLVVANSTGFSVLENLSNRSNCVAVKGDLNDDGSLTIADAVLLLNCAFLGSGYCLLCFSDVNCNGILTAADVVLELNKVFLGVPFPCQ